MSNNQDLEDQIDQKELAPGVLLIKEYKKVENDQNIPDIVGIFTFKVQLKTMNVLLKLIVVSGTLYKSP